MKRWHAEGLGVKTIASRLGRSTDTISKHIFKKHVRGAKPVGRPAAITPAVLKKVKATYTKMISEVSAKSEVTVGKIKHRL